MRFCFVAVYKLWIHKGFAYERTYIMSRFNTATKPIFYSPTMACSLSMFIHYTSKLLGDSH